MITEWCGDQPSTSHKPHRWSKDGGLNYLKCEGGPDEAQPTPSSRVQLVVTYNDHAIMYYRIGSGAWRVDSATRQIVIGRGVPRTYIPLDQVRSYDVMDMEPRP